MKTHAGSGEGPPAVAVADLGYAYGARTALRGVGFTVAPGEIFGLLGPNGGGKTTLFRILSTLYRPATGSVRLFDLDPVRRPDAVRRRIGVVFQSPSLDGHLTVTENLRHQGHLYGLRGEPLRERIRRLLERMGLGDRARERVQHLSGGQQRRVELAKGLLHQPALLLLDEPSTGLDPGARRGFWEHLESLRATREVTILLTTHLMEEADQCDRVAILDRGALVALGPPAALKEEIAGEVITIQTPAPDALRAAIQDRFGGAPMVAGGAVRLQRTDGHAFVGRLREAFGDRITAVTLGRPTLEDVFLQRTGHRFWEEEGAA